MRSMFCIDGRSSRDSTVAFRAGTVTVEKRPIAETMKPTTAFKLQKIANRRGHKPADEVMRSFPDWGNAGKVGSYTRNLIIV